MPEVTDELLMAYADGALSALARKKVEAYLQANADGRRRVEIYRATGAPLSSLYGRSFSEPIPAHLKDFVLNYPLNAEKLETVPPKAARAAWRSRFAKGARFLTAPLVQVMQAPATAGAWRLAAASTLGVAIGLGAGAFLHHGDAGSGDLVALQDGRFYASGPLRDVLEKDLSGHESRIGGVRGEAVTMRASLTFKNKQNTYCREYEIATPDKGGFVGLGCRDRDGRWALEAQLPANKTAAKGGVKTAAGADNAALDAIVDDMIDGDALGGKQEADKIKDGWK